MSEETTTTNHQNGADRLTRMDSGYSQSQNARLTRMAASSLEMGFKPFLSDFDPEKSEREKRKLKQRLYPRGRKRASYDERGIYMRTGEDLCDCLERNCPGCHNPCAKCKSPRCGHECRANRKWVYDSIAYEGTDVVVKNRIAMD